MKRREFIGSCLAGAVAVPSVLTNTVLVKPLLANPPDSAQLPRGKAEHCVMIWLGGGMAQIDTFDPKAEGDVKAKKAGSYYPAIDTAVADVQVCEHLEHTARLMDRFTILRTVGHDVVDEHAAATNRMHTGRLTSGTVQYPSLGSIVAHERGAVSPDVPAYVLIGYPNLTRGPGFLGQKAGFIYLTDTKSGPASLARSAQVTAERRTRREQLLGLVRAGGAERFAGDTLYRDYDTAVAESLRLSGPEFMRVFDLSDEPDSLRNEYGADFGERCLVARRLCESGVRFVEVSHNMNFRNGTGWDTHNDGQLNQHLLIAELDQALGAMVRDLESRAMLDKTLIIVNTEFGRPAQFDSGGGRGHYSKCFSVVLAGGGLRHQGAYGTSDELAMTAVENPVTVPDFFATALATLGIDPNSNLYDGNRPVPITDQGTPIAALF